MPGDVAGRAHASLGVRRELRFFLVRAEIAEHQGQFLVLRHLRNDQLGALIGAQPGVHPRFHGARGGGLGVSGGRRQRRGQHQGHHQTPHLLSLHSFSSRLRLWLYARRSLAKLVDWRLFSTIHESDRGLHN
jgi:hypothetical protein